MQIEFTTKWANQLFTEAGWAWLQNQKLSSTVHHGEVNLDHTVENSAFGVQPSTQYEKGTLGDLNLSLLHTLAHYANKCDEAYIAACQNVITAMEAITELDFNNG